MARHQKRGARNLARKQAKRDPYDRVLIVCEGKKTEFFYFNELIVHYRLNTANITVDNRSDSAPINVYERAWELYQQSVKDKMPYDRVYCLFDRDTHSTYQSTIQTIQTLKRPKGVFFAVPSVPCFEYWLLLHFKRTAKPYDLCGGVIEELKRELPHYEKANQALFSELFDRLETAKKHAASTLKSAIENQTDNPTTYVHELVHYLQHLKD